MNTLLKRYVERGFRLVFYPARRKGPIGPDATGWTTRVYDPADYHEGDNVGTMLGVEISPAKYLVDVDFDWDGGRPLITALFPKTDFGFGRKSRPLSHVLFTVDQPLITRKFEDIDNDTLVELRGTKTDGTLGFQTMIPPSIHPSEEMVELKSDGDIGHVVGDDLAQAVALYAVGCLLLKHLGPHGVTHEARLAISSWMLKRDIPEAQVARLLGAMCRASGNDDRDAATVVASTVARLKRGDPVSAKLPEVLGDEGPRLVSRLGDWLGDGDDLAADIDRLNTRFGIVSVGGTVVVMENSDDGGVKQLWPFREFRKLLVKEHVWDGTKRKALADVWLNHPDGRQHDRLVYAMPGSHEVASERDYNGYLSFTVEPAPGDWSKNRDHIKKIICRGDDKLFRWVLNWLAALFQYPGRHAWAALVLRGGQGTGKGHFADRTIGRCFHPQQYVHVTGGDMLTGRFNAHLSGKCFVFADEATWGGDPKAVNRLKGLVTESTIAIERKFIDAIEEPSALHIVVASNDEWPVAIEKDDRRFVVLDVKESRRQDQPYFGSLIEELESGGRGAMLDELLAMEIDEGLLRTPPMTEAKQELAIESLDPIDAWWLDKLANGRLLADHQDDWPDEVSKGELHSDYLLVSRQQGAQRRASQTKLWKRLRQLVKIRESRKLFGETQVRVVSLPTLSDCRASWLKRVGWPKTYDWNQ